VTVSGQQLWAGVTGVSNAGKKKGRGKRVGRKKATDLNKGQRLGVGKFSFFKVGTFISTAKVYIYLTRVLNRILMFY